MNTPAHDSSAPLGAARRALNFLYSITAAAAGLCMIGVCVAVLASIVGRQLDFSVPGVDAYAGYLAAGAGFFALADTFKRGEHIRVTLVLNAFKGPWRRALEIWSLFAASFLAALFAYYSVRLCFQSYELNDISGGIDATHMWIPQVSMAVGAVVLLVAFVDELILELRGERALVQSDEALHVE